MIAPDVQSRIDALLATGAYDSVEEVLGDALSALEAMTTHAHLLDDPELHEKIQQGIRSIEAGHYITLTAESIPAFFEDIKARGRARLRQTAHAS
jgi:hypothetical protein